MSGGFFRGTSAEQDTRFSNKQAKLLKTQKFAPELEHLVDVTRVKMDVIKPWIAKRVTELLGFEDEVLINFIYGLLEGKEINGKQVQIQLTGFMEKHTGKFMKELWSLLLSAQKNASGVPQQFLDAKEEETRKKKEELDWIGNEVQKRKEKGSRESEHVNSKMDGGVINDSTMEPNSKDVRAKDSKVYSDDEKAAGARNGFKGRDRPSRSPRSADQPLSPHRKARSRSGSKSYSNSRSYSEGRNRSRSMSGSPPSRRHSISSERKHRCSQRSLSPVRRRSSTESLSPRRRSPPRRRSTSRSHYRSPSPLRRRVRSPARRRSPSPLRRRSPVRRRSRSPLQRRSRSPRRHQSPSLWRRRSPSPRWRRSPSPWRRRRSRRSPSPRRRRSPSPWRRRSPSPRRRRSPFPKRRLSPSPPRRHRRRSLSSPSPVRRKPSSPSRRRSPSPVKRRSPSQASVSRSPSPVKRRVRASAQARSPTPLDRSSSTHSWSTSPVRRGSHSPSKGKLPMLKKSASRSPRDRLRSPEQSSPSYQRTQKKRSVTPDESYRGRDSRVCARRMPSISLSPRRDHRDGTDSRKKVPSLSPSPRKSLSNSRSPPCFKDQTPSEGRREDIEYKSKRTQRSIHSPRQKSMDSPEKSSGRLHHDDIYLRKKEKEMRSEDLLSTELPASRKSRGDNSSSHEMPPELSLRDDLKEEETIKKGDLNSPTLGFAGSEGSGKHKKRKHRKSSHREVGSDSSSDDSDVDDRKEAKRRRKEEKKLRKEERRRRREERRRRKEEKRAQKRKTRSRDSDSLSSDSDKHENDVNVSGGYRVAGKESYSSDKEETESEKKRLENELREKALQKLRAKKGISH